jgi:deoxyribodipyrimidine photolyase
VRRWLPVLAALPPQHIHQPWAAPPEVLEDAGASSSLLVRLWACVGRVW